MLGELPSVPGPERPAAEGFASHHLSENSAHVLHGPAQFSRPDVSLVKLCATPDVLRVDSDQNPLGLAGSWGGLPPEQRDGAGISVIWCVRFGEILNVQGIAVRVPVFTLTAWLVSSINQQALAIDTVRRWTPTPHLPARQFSTTAATAPANMSRCRVETGTQFSVHPRT